MLRTFLNPSVLLALAVAIAVPRASAAQRRGSPGAVVPMTDVKITLGTTTVTGRVDAKCSVDERATPTNTRGYLVLMYPWFGQRVVPDKPQWRFDLHIRRGTTFEASNQFVFSFHGERMGTGPVRVTRRRGGARFEVDGRSGKGEAIRATIDCSAFQKSEAAGG